MKNIHFILLGSLLLGLSTPSCSDMLETKNFTDMTASNFFKSEGDIDAAVIGLYLPTTTNWGYSDGGTGSWYNSLFTADANSYYVAGMLSTDIVKPYSTNTFDEFTFGPATGSALTNTYNVIRFVARATDVIQQTSQASSVNEEVRNRFIAECKTLRAFYMYTLLDWFGPVNVKLDPSTLNDNTIDSRPNESTYVEYILKDLEEAINTTSFPEKYNNDESNWGRMSKAIAYAIRMRAYMHQKDWTNAKTDAEQLMKMGFSIISKYEDVFNTDRTSEHIWSVPANTASDNYYITEVLPSDFKKGYNLKGRPYIRGTEEQFQPGWQAYCMRWDFYDTFDDNDIRKESILCEYDNLNGKRITRETMSGALPIKYTDTQFYNPGIQKAMPIIRYAEVLLSFAEAENELNGPTPQAIEAVEQITNRAHTSIPALVKTSRESFREFILAERGRELFCEGQRRQDLIRHGVFISLARERGNNAEDYHILYPIPQNVIIEAGGILKQNLGYPQSTSK